MSPMPRDTCVRFPLSQASFFFYNGLNRYPEFYAVGPGRVDRGHYTLHNNLRTCGPFSRASESTNPNEIYENINVCDQRANEAGVTFSGCLDYVSDTSTCAGWVSFMNCASDSFNEQACDNSDLTPKSYGPSANGYISSWVSHLELRKRAGGTGNDTNDGYDGDGVDIFPTGNHTGPAGFGKSLFALLEARKNAPDGCTGPYADIVAVKDHPLATQQYCNGTDHITVFDQGTVLTRFHDTDCGGHKDNNFF